MKKVHNGKYQKCPVNNARNIFGITRVMYLVHNRLDLAIVWCTII